MIREPLVWKLAIRISRWLIDVTLTTYDCLRDFFWFISRLIP